MSWNYLGRKKFFNKSDNRKILSPDKRSFKIINIDDELDVFNRSGFDFIEYLEANALYVRKKPHTSFEYFSLKKL